MKYSLIFLCSFLSGVVGNQSLLQMSQHSTCIRNIVNNFIHKQSCQSLTDEDKSMMAHSMVSCLNIKLGKKPLQACSKLAQCKIYGQDWNTFTTFFTHIDNLCHFYWQVLRHEKTQKLVQSLSESALVSEAIMVKNYNSTEKILSMQQIIKEFMQLSMKNNMKLSQTLQISQKKLQNMTNDLGLFFSNLHQDLDQQYSSVTNILSTINSGIQSLNTVQRVMMSDLGSIFGVLYFLLAFMIVGIFSSFQCFRGKRKQYFGVLMSNVIFELIIPNLMIEFVGRSNLRLLSISLVIILFAVEFFSYQGDFGQVRSHIDKRLQTQRIKRIFRQILEEEKMAQNIIQIEQN